MNGMPDSWIIAIINLIEEIGLHKDTVPVNGWRGQIVPRK